VTRTEEVYSGYSRDPRKQRAWAADNPGNAVIRDELLAEVLERALPLLERGGDALDAGCGTGWLLRSLADAGVPPARLAGIDLLPGRAEAAASAVPGARVSAGDVRRLELPDDAFSVVTMLTVLSSLPSREAVREALAEARRVLAPGGLLLVYEPRVPNPLNRNTLLLRDADLDASGVLPRQGMSLTVMPPLARRLGSRAAERYRRLARVPALRTHRLIAYREPAA
jgi:ubiquinone/menaquinone biosynthesis C-methylase UbiE